MDLHSIYTQHVKPTFIVCLCNSYSLLKPKKFTRATFLKACSIYLQNPTVLLDWM